MSFFLALSFYIKLRLFFLIEPFYHKLNAWPVLCFDFYFLSCFYNLWRVFIVVLKGA